MSEEERGSVEPASAASDDAAVKLRRDALKKLGLYGAVAAPALIAILQADKAQAASPIGDPINGMCTVDPPDCTFW